MAMQRIRGLLFCALWASSAVTGFYFLFAPILPLIVIDRKAYRRITDNLAAIWESCQAVGYSSIVELGDNEAGACRELISTLP